jgi:DNA-binding CsgD family transcriptional regulator
VPGVVTFDHADQLIAGTKEASRLMGLIPGESATTLRAVAVQARMREEASIRVRLDDGRWLLVQAARMHGAGEAAPEVAVTLMPAPRSIMLPVVLALHALSAREREVAQLLQRGLRTEQIAARLHISPHTLRDHIKSVFHKLQVNHRAELMALVSQYVTPDGDPGAA